MTSATPKPRAGELTGAPRESSKDASEADWHRLLAEEHADLKAERDLLRERERELVEALKAASEALRSSRHIMGDAYNRELAVELADKCDAALAKHGR